MTPDSRQAMQSNVESFYQNFITRVAVGRKLRVDFVDSIARGRVWAAEDAKHLGLVDDYGGIKESIRSAAELAKIKPLDQYFTEERDLRNIQVLLERTNVKGSLDVRVSAQGTTATPSARSQG